MSLTRLKITTESFGRGDGELLESEILRQLPRNRPRREGSRYRRIDKGLILGIYNGAYSTRGNIMHSSGKNCLNTSHIGRQSGTTNVPTAITYSAPILAVLSLLLLFTARAAQAQTETILYNFTGGSDGGDSRSRLTPDGKGNFYGTTNYGGLPGSWGTVFELSANGNGGWTETVIYTFKGGAHGSHPLFSGVIFDSTENLYGTTYDGGVGCAPNGCGTVYKLTPKESKWTETVLYSFAGGVNDGFNPSAGLVMDAAGNLYGTTYSGGSAGGGIVFELSRSGGKWTEQILYASANGLYYFGMGGIAIDPAGNLYGNNDDSVFELSPSGMGSWNLNVLHTFTGPTCQNCALGTPAFDRAGNLYGTTVMEGPWGGVFKLSPDKNGKWKEAANLLWFLGTLYLSGHVPVLRTVARLNRQSAVGPQLPLGTEPVRGLHQCDQQSASNRTDRRNPAQYFRGALLPALGQQIPAHRLAQPSQSIERAKAQAARAACTSARSHTAA